MMLALGRSVFSYGVAQLVAVSGQGQNTNRVLG